MLIRNLDTKAPIDLWGVVDCAGNFEICESKKIAAAKNTYDELRWPTAGPHRIVHLIEAEDTAPPRSK